MGGVGSGPKKRNRAIIPLSGVKPKSAPRWLDKEAKSEWRKLVDVLDRVPNLMKEPDWYLVSILADSLAAYKRTVGVLNGTATMDIKQHQVVRLKIESKNTILECLRQLGMTPMSRRQLHGQEKQAEAENPLGAYVFKLGQE